MNFCFPVTEDKGLESPLSGHFGQAPFFLFVNGESGRMHSMANAPHGHGGCAPVDTLAAQGVSVMVVAGIGHGALNRLRAAGIEVVQATKPTVGATLADLKAGGPTGEIATCGGHGHGHGHGEGHSCT